MAHDQEVVGSNPGTIYWMEVSDDASCYIKENWKIKEAKWGTSKRTKTNYTIQNLTVAQIFYTHMLLVNLCIGSHITSDQIKIGHIKRLQFRI